MDDKQVFEKLMKERPDDVIRVAKCLEEERKYQQKADYYLKAFQKKINVDVKPLTKAQEDELRKAWGKLWDNGIYKPEWNAIYSSIAGEFNPYFIPQDLHYFHVERKKLDRPYQIAFSDKNYSELIFPTLRVPGTLARRMRGIWLDASYQKIGKAAVMDIIRKEKEKGVVIKKSRESSGGAGVSFVSAATPDEEISKLLDTSKHLQIQRCITQHKDMARLNGSSINTVRMMTAIVDGEVQVLSAVVRIGASGSRMDNISQGGFACGIQEDGSLTEFGFTNKGERSRQHPNGLVFRDGRIPNYQHVVDTIKRHHYYVPMLGVISWDICIDKDGEPVLIEVNIGEGGIGLHQYNNGPLYGKYREKLLAETFKDYYEQGATLDFNYRRYAKACIIEKGSRYASHLEIPAELDGRPVTRIGTGAFDSSKNLMSVTLPDTLTSIGKIAFFSCRNLREIKFGTGLQEVEQSAFNECMAVESMFFHSGLKRIGARCFWDCKSLRDIWLPATVEQIDPAAFKNTSGMRVHCVAGSYAERYARDHQIAVVLEEPF